MVAVAVLWLGSASPALAHTLGIDRATLTEGDGGSYALVSIVPQQLAPAIRTPVLPTQCDFVGRPGGEVGTYEVRFTFTCATPLTADDVLVLPWQREGAMLTATWRDGTSRTALVSREGAAMTVDLGPFLAGSGTLLDAAGRYTALGIEHILLGIDHLLFVLGLLLLVRDRWMLVKTITAFTVAHSITLGLATLGFVHVPSRPVEAAIALSIVFVAVEALHARQGRLGLSARHPWIVAFGFGLLHGFGFAGALSEIGLPPSEIPIALLFFNIGVEVGQLAFVGVLLAVVWASPGRVADRPAWVAVAPAYAIGTLATFWFFERAALLLPPL